MDRQTLREYIITNEGFILTVYLDSLGIKTIGVGFNLERADANLRISALGLNYNFVRTGKISLTPRQAIQLLEADIDIAIEDANALFSNFSSLSNERQIILVDMAYNMGKTRLAGFVNLIASVKVGDWFSASLEMQYSNWANQVGRRAKWNIEGMRTNSLPNLQSHLPEIYKTLGQI